MIRGDLLVVVKNSNLDKGHCQGTMVAGCRTRGRSWLEQNREIDVSWLTGSRKALQISRDFSMILLDLDEAQNNNMCNRRQGAGVRGFGGGQFRGLPRPAEAGVGATPYRPRGAAWLSLKRGRQPRSVSIPAPSTNCVSTWVFHALL